MTSLEIDSKNKVKKIKHIEKNAELIYENLDKFVNITPKQIVNKEFPISKLNYNSLMKILFPNVGKPKLNETGWVDRGFSGEHHNQVKILRKIGVLVRNPDIDKDTKVRYYLNLKRLENVLKNKIKREEKIESINAKQFDDYFRST